MAMIHEYHIDGAMLHLWERNSLQKMKHKNSDRVYIVDGRERIGKSLFTFQQMCAIEPELLESPEKLVSRICFTPDEFNKVARETKNGAFAFDEAFRGLSSRGAMSKINKKIVQTLMEMGQNNNIAFIVLPSVFLLDIYPAMLRSDGLFHIHESKKSKQRCFTGYNRQDKNRLYQIGLKKGWTYPFGSPFKGHFSKKFPGGEEFEKAYLKKKADALRNIDDAAFEDKLVTIAKRMRDVEGKSWIEIGKSLGMSAEAIRKRVARTTIQPYNTLNEKDDSSEQVVREH